MPDYKIETVGAGAEIVAVPADRFKTNELSISFLCRFRMKQLR